MAMGNPSKKRLLTMWMFRLSSGALAAGARGGPVDIPTIILHCHLGAIQLLTGMDSDISYPSRSGSTYFEPAPLFITTVVITLVNSSTQHIYDPRTQTYLQCHINSSNHSSLSTAPLYPSSSKQMISNLIK
jgi:hypothetical protein